MCQDQAVGVHRLGEEDERGTDEGKEAPADCGESALSEQEQAVGKSDSPLQR